MSSLTQIAWSSVRLHMGRTALTAIAVSLGICVILGVEIASAGLNSQAVAAAQLSAGSSDLDVRVATGTGLTAANVSSLAAVPGVQQAVALYEKRDVAYTSLSDSQGQIVTLISIDNGTAALRPVVLTAGRLPTAANEIAIDSGLAAQLGSVHIGSTLLLSTNTAPEKFTVVGISSGTTGGAEFTNSAIFVDQSTLTSAFSDGLRVPLVALQLTSGADPIAVAHAIRSGLGTAASVIDPRSGGGPLDQLAPLLIMLTVLSVVIGGGVTANSVGLSVSERRREIALLRTAGASGNQVFRLFVYEAGLQALIGIPLGLFAGIWLGVVLTAQLAASSLPAPGVTVDLPSIVVAVLVGVAAAVLGATIPASIASHTPILSGLRAQAGARQRLHWRLVACAPVLAVLSALCFIGGGTVASATGTALLLAAIAALLPAVVPWVVRLLGTALRPVFAQSSVASANLVRRRNRTALTATGLCLAVAAAVATSALAAGATTASDQWVDHLFVGNVVIKSSVPQGDTVAEAIAEDLKNDSADPEPGRPLRGHVSRVIAIRIIPEVVSGDVMGIAVVPFSSPPANSGQTSYLDSYPAVGGLNVLQPARNVAITELINTPSVLAPQSLATANGWQVGSQISIEGADGTLHAFRVAGIVDHSFPAGDGRETLVMDTAMADATFGREVISGSSSTPYVASGFDLLDVTSDGDYSAVTTIADRYGLQTIEVSTIKAAARTSLDHSIGLLEAIAIISVMVAMLAVVNTMVVNVRTGVRELALLRAVGLSRRDAQRLLLTESGLMALSATLIGAAAGALVALPMLSASSSIGFEPAYNFPAATALAIVVTVVIAALVATIAPARRAARMSIVATIRYE